MFAVARPKRRIALGLTLLAGLLVAQAWSAAPARAAAAPAYDSLPATMPPSWVSLGYQAQRTAEFGDLVELGGTHRDLTAVTVGFVDWACETGGGSTCATTPGATWTHPITVNLYAEGVAPMPGALLGTVTQTVTVPYRPSADPANCGVGASAWFNPSTATCHNGFAFTATFDFSTLALTLPDRVIVAIAYNTETWGASPLGVPGPYSSLNVALGGSPTVGTNVDADSMYWNTQNAASYVDGGAAGVGILRADDGGWSNFGLVLEIVTDEPPAPQAAPQAAPALPAPAAGSGSGGGGPTLAETGQEPDVRALIVALLAITVGAALVFAAPRRMGAHRA